MTLEISYKIMKLERMFRLKRFRMQVEGMPSMKSLDEGRMHFKETCQFIMKEAGALFRCVLNYVENSIVVSDGFREDLSEDVAEPGMGNGL